MAEQCGLSGSVIVIRNSHYGVGKIQRGYSPGLESVSPGSAHRSF
jgi:hypothetical protein